MTKHKRRHLLEKIEQLEPQYNKHQRKLEDAKKAGGYISSIEKEIHTWRNKKDELEGRL